ncbi:MAG: chemotaxis-specific protein-glutamate methyltransferase CheB [Azospirillaceae bacterium]|nr:chemotaxis-specific protein-glutamate methyltransferase CheB [Azospirillaceae bacterium]
MAKVLIVDDSALMRRYLKQILESKGGFETMVVRNGIEALAALDAFDPDVITLDVNMPEMDGLTCLSNIMTQRPKPVVMVSSLTARGAEVTFEALALGAVDFIHKPDGTISLNIGRVEHELVAKVTMASQIRLSHTVGLQQRLRRQHDGRDDGKSRRDRQEASTSMATSRTASGMATAGPPVNTATGIGVVLIGVSTGGPGTLEQVLPVFAADFPWPVVVAQHMPGTFTTVFAKRLNDMCNLTVIEAAQMMPLQPGVIYIGKGDADIVVGKRAAGWVVNPTPADSRFLWHPSVARLVDSAMKALPPDRIIGVLLTGMGDDGAEAMTALKRCGGRTVAQDEATAIIWGMPGELVKRGGATQVLPADRIAGQLTAWLTPAPSRAAPARAAMTREGRDGTR